MTDNLQKLIENGGWRPIEEAPKDGNDILLKTSDGCVYFGFWGSRIDIDEWLFNDGCTFSRGEEPTHFMLLDTPERMAKVIEYLIKKFPRDDHDGDPRYIGIKPHYLTVFEQVNQIAAGEMGGDGE